MLMGGVPETVEGESQMRTAIANVSGAAIVKGSIRRHVIGEV
jgi:hypothetical protein